MKQETEQALKECINTLSKLLDNDNPQVQREGTIVLKTFDTMLMVSNEWSRVYAGVIERAKLEEETFDIDYEWQFNVAETLYKQKFRS